MRDDFLSPQRPSRTRHSAHDNQAASVGLKKRCRPPKENVAIKTVLIRNRQSNDVGQHPHKTLFSNSNTLSLSSTGAKRKRATAIFEINASHQKCVKGKHINLDVLTTFLCLGKVKTSDSPTEIPSEMFRKPNCK